MNKEYVNAPFFRRGIAFVIDAAMAFLPALVVYILFTGGYKGLAPVYYPAPIIGAVSMVDLPVEVNEKVSHVTTDEGGTISTTNYSMTATGARLLSVVVIVMYVGYGTFCTIVYDGKTIGKKFMKIKVVSENEEKMTKSFLLRELLGKVVVNSTVVVPAVSVFMAAFGKDKKTVHDYIGKTRVVME